MRFSTTVPISIRTILADFSGSLRGSQRAKRFKRRRISVNSRGLTVISTVKYLYSYLIEPLQGHKVLKKAPIRSSPKSHLTFEAVPLSRLLSGLRRHKRDNK